MKYRIIGRQGNHRFYIGEVVTYLGNVNEGTVVASDMRWCACPEPVAPLIMENDKGVSYACSPCDVELI